jgi:hypothetical protein
MKGGRWVPCLAVGCAIGALVDFGPARESAAAKVAKVDLTEYLDGFPQVGDFRVYNRNDGETETANLLSVLENKKSTDYETEFNDAGDIEDDFTETVHGKEDRVGRIVSGDITFVAPHPKRVQSFVLVPGKPQKFKIGMTVFFQGAKAGKATIAGANTFVGLESISTPLGDFTQVAHIHHDQTVTVKVGHSILQAISTSDSWISLELGTVRVDRMSQTYQDGVPQQTFGPFEYTFDHGQYQGVAIP